MKTVIMTTSLLLAAAGVLGWAQVSMAEDAHHAAPAAQSAPAPAERAAASGAADTAASTPATGGSARDLMNEMQNMPAHDHGNHDSCCTLRKSEPSQQK